MNIYSGITYYSTSCLAFGFKKYYNTGHMAVEARRVIRPLIIAGATGGLLKGAHMAFIESTQFATPPSSISQADLIKSQWAAHQTFPDSSKWLVFDGSVLMAASIFAGAYAIYGMRRRRS